jgi:hypothetical protein
MNVQKLKITGIDKSEILEHLKGQLSFDYENHSTDMSVLATEDYYMRNNSTQLNMIIAKVKDSCIYLDIIGSAGGTGFLNINFWSEKGYVKKVLKILEKHREEHNYTIEQL